MSLVVRDGAALVFAARRRLELLEQVVLRVHLRVERVDGGVAQLAALLLLLLLRRVKLQFPRMFISTLLILTESS